MTPPLETKEPTAEEWQVWADGACGVGGSEIGILLQSQAGIKLQYATKLAFKAMNNVVEYEAMIMALRIIKEIGIQKSDIHSDSQLVVNQC